MELPSSDVRAWELYHTESEVLMADTELVFLSASTIAIVLFPQKVSVKKVSSP